MNETIVTVTGMICQTAFKIALVYCISKPFWGVDLKKIIINNGSTEDKE